MRNQVVDCIAGTTLMLTWVNSGVVPESMSFSLLDKDENVLSSPTAVSSGNGMYYAPVLIPNSASAWYVARSIAVIQGNSYVNKLLVRSRTLEAD